MHLKVSAYPIPNIKFQLTSKLQPSSSCLFHGLTHVCCIPVTRNYLSPSPGSSSSCLSPGQGCFCLVLALQENLFLLKALGQVLHSLYTGLLIFLRRKKKTPSASWRSHRHLQLCAYSEDAPTFQGIAIICLTDKASLKLEVGSYAILFYPKYPMNLALSCFTEYSVNLNFINEIT